MIRLFSGNERSEIDWELYKNGIEVQKYFEHMLEEGTSCFVKNIQAELFIIQVDEWLLPVTKTVPDERNSYVVSPYTHYVRYAIEELKELKQPFLERLLKCFLQVFGLKLKWGKVDQVVIVNNWLLSTNLYENLTSDQARQILLYLKGIFPDHAIVFRSLTERLNGHILKGLKSGGCHLIPSRSVYLFNPANIDKMSKRQRKAIRYDRRFLKESGYMVEEGISGGETTRVLELYNQLYLNKYSFYNPQFTERFLRNTMENGLFTFKVLKNADKIDGVIGFFTRNGVMTTPILGYDTSLPKEKGLYRLCSLLLTEHSLKSGLLLHRSAGAGKFKLIRGAQNETEYSAVYTKHLTQRSRLMWKTLELLLTKVGVPLLKRFEL